MKIFWLNPEKTKARLVRGLFTKYEAVVQTNGSRCGKLSTDCPRLHSTWYYASTGRQAGCNLSIILSERASKDACKEYDNKEWVKVEPIPTARLLDESGWIEP